MEISPPTNQVDIQDYWGAIKHGWRIWLSAGLIATITAGVWSYCIRATEYRVEASIVAAGELSPGSSRLTGILAKVPIELPTEVGSAAELCGYILQTRATRDAVVKKCHLQEVVGASSPAEASRQLAGWTRIELDRPNIVRLELTVPGRTRVVGLWASKGQQRTGGQAAQIVTSYLRALEERLGELQLTAANGNAFFCTSRSSRWR